VPALPFETVQLNCEEKISKTMPVHRKSSARKVQLVEKQVVRKKIQGSRKKITKKIPVGTKKSARKFQSVEKNQ
jgi:hypothetical protein